MHLRVIKRLLLIGLILNITIPSYSAPPVRQNTYISLAVISPTDVMANENVVFTYLSAGVDTYAANSITGTALSSSIAITSSGNMTFSGTTNITGTLQLSGTAITSTATEINLIDGLTASATELNILDGATLTTTELNYVDGVTSAIQTQLDGKCATTGNASIVTVGTITTGGWGATAIPVAYGGTGATSAANARSNLSAASSGANSDITSLTGLSTALGTAYGGTASTSTTYCNLASNVTGTLPIANGGTARTTGTVPMMKVGTYTGDNTNNRAITGVGFQPAFLIIWRKENGFSACMASDEDAGYTIYSNNYNTGAIDSLNADGFTISNSGNPNINTTDKVYVYIAFKE